MKMSLTAIGVGMAALAVIGGGLGIGFATSSAVTEKFVVPY
jgi:F-type H+-transporting ATPase subunit c